MHNPDQLALLIAFMLFTFVVMGVMSYVFAKWVKRHKELTENLPTGTAHGSSHGHH